MEGIIFNIQRYSLDDGPGMRTTVFFKGCPLRCLWCSNPESQDPEPMISYRYTSCKRCGACLESCPRGAVSMAEDGVHIDRSLCDRCGACIRVCRNDALRWAGERVSVDRVMKTVLRDRLYYETSGGGVTCSGGEILMQPDFAAEIFRRCREEGIHTNADTCGFGSEEALRKVMTYADLSYFDLKHLSPDRHKQYTGVSNEMILRNLRLTLELGVKVVVRVPLIPEYNCDAENLRTLAETVKAMGDGIESVCFLPYHSYGASKYRMIDRVYPLEALRKLTPEEEQLAISVLKEYDLSCKISK